MNFKKAAAFHSFAYFKPHRGLFALDLVCATIVALIDLAFPMVTRKSMYDLLPQQQYRAFSSSWV